MEKWHVSVLAGKRMNLFKWIMTLIMKEISKT